MMNEKKIVARTIITIDADEDGQARAIAHFDPPLPDKTGLTEDQWLELIPSPQLAGILVMDQIMDAFGSDIEIIALDEVQSGTKH